MLDRENDTTSVQLNYSAPRNAYESIEKKRRRVRRLRAAPLVAGCAPLPAPLPVRTSPTNKLTAGFRRGHNRFVVFPPPTPTPPPRAVDTLRNSGKAPGVALTSAGVETATARTGRPLAQSRPRSATPRRRARPGRAAPARRLSCGADRGVSNPLSPN